MEHWIVLAMVMDRRFGKGSRLKSHDSHVGGLGHWYTQTVNLGTVQWTSPNLSELGMLSAGPSVDSSNALVFAVW